jgi:hypothetical protein
MRQAGGENDNHHFGRSQYAPFDRALNSHATIGGMTGPMKSG